MSLQWEQVVVDANDPVALGQWWAAALGWVVVNDDPGAFEIQREPDVLPGMLFLPVGDNPSSKNPLHLDFRPDDQDVEVARLTELGAKRVHVGQGDVSWVVMADPEDNEFCVLSAPTS